MTIRHHPPDETLLQYATGALREGPALVVATHFAYCAACRERAAVLEAVGGVLIDDLPPAELSADALSATLARLDGITRADADARAADRGDAHPPGRNATGELSSGARRDADLAAAGREARHRGAARALAHPDLPAGLAWPVPLQAYAIGNWRLIAPGVRWSRVALTGEQSRAAGAGMAMLLRVRPETKLPAHGHHGAEYTCVLTGAFSDEDGTYHAGDLIETDETDDHQPVSGPDGECICLIATEGPLRLHGVLGRLLQPFLGI